MTTYIGIDNGVTGTIGVIEGDKSYFIETPIKKEQSYTKKKQNISRIDHIKLYKFLSGIGPAKALVERPMINSKMFKTSMSASRSLESTLIVLESLGIPFEYEDSKSWQKELLPQGIKGAPALKKASMDIGIRMFPSHKELIMKHKDADGILIAEYCRRKYR